MLAGTVVAPPKPRGRLRRSDCSGPGLRRVKRGKGFTYLDEHGERIHDPSALERLRGLVIPPAWQDVWICPDPLGHLQATGIDASGRKQYLYHSRWREHRDRQKFEKMVRFGSKLPELRVGIARDLSGKAPSRERVLAGAMRLLDRGVFRIGSEEYADEDGGIGLATIRREHVTVRADGTIEFDYPAKSGVRRKLTLDDPLVRPLLATLKRRRGGGEELLAYRHRRSWHRLRSDDINEYLKEQLGEDFSAKDFRTWHATVTAAEHLARHGREATTKTARKRAIDSAVRVVAQQLGNTPAVARKAYIDPRVFDRYQNAWVISPAVHEADTTDDSDRRQAIVEAAVVDLLTEPHASETVDRIVEDAAG
jgi:DNA topoisomerase IB